jgi:two component regulator with propeller domain
MKKSIRCLPLSLVLLALCNGQNEPENAGDIASGKAPASKEKPFFQVFNTATKSVVDKNIRSIFQDHSGNYWFGTNGAGVYRSDGKTFIQYTDKNGLSDNQVQRIQEDKSGNILFGTGAFGVSKFDGKVFTTLTDIGNLRLRNGSAGDWKSESNDLWFCAGGGAYRYHGDSLVYLPLGKAGIKHTQAQGSPFILSRYAVYSILKDRKGNVWFGTQAQGVCSYNGKTLTWFTEKGLSGSAVLALFEDSKGNLWFGNNGSGLFRWNGKSLVNFTEEKGLGNKEFKISGSSGPGTLARIYAINEDNFGNLWIGTVDAGVWKYDGNHLTHYTTKNGLTSNAVNSIYKDKNGELLFGTDGDGISKFNGIGFTGFF